MKMKTPVIFVAGFFSLCNCALTGLRGGLHEQAFQTAPDVSFVEFAATQEGAQSSSLLAKHARAVHDIVSGVGARLLGRQSGGQQPKGRPEAPLLGTAGTGGGRFFFQLLFAGIYYCLIVSKYPRLNADAAVYSKEVQELQALDAVSATCSPKMSFANAIYSLICTGPRAAHTFHSVGIMRYWVGCCLMACFPCCTLIYTNSCTDLNVKLGGERQNVVMTVLCAMCCTCCLVAQDAQTLDLAIGQKTGFCYVYDALAESEGRDDGRYFYRGGDGGRT